MDFLEFIEKSNSCSSREELLGFFDAALTQLGIDKFVYSVMRGSFADQGKIYHGVARSYPEEWMKYYAEKGYINNDPTYRRALSCKGVFSWKELCDETAMTKAERRVMDEADEAGLKNGLSVSLHGPLGEAAGFGFASDSRHEPLTVNQKSLLLAIANQFHLTYLGLEEKPPQTAGKLALTDRQREVLQWAAVGKSRPVIADIMKISEDTVDDHFRQIFKKLGCNDRIVSGAEGYSDGYDPRLAAFCHTPRLRSL